MKFLITRTLEYRIEAADRPEVMEMFSHMGIEDANEDFAEIQEFPLKPGKFKHMRLIRLEAIVKIVNDFPWGETVSLPDDLKKALKELEEWESAKSVKVRVNGVAMIKAMKELEE